MKIQAQSSQNIVNQDNRESKSTNNQKQHKVDSFLAMIEESHKNDLELECNMNISNRDIERVECSTATVTCSCPAVCACSTSLFC